MENNTCLHCNKPLKGRSDKKYCNHLCRNEFNNLRIRAYARDVSVKRINGILQQNREILSRIIQKESALTVETSVLISYGFHFNFHTHTVQAKEKMKVFCYDLGYMKKNEREVYVFGIE
jgi:hypothetical protein